MKVLTESNIKKRFELMYQAAVAETDWRGFTLIIDSTYPTGETYGGAIGLGGVVEAATLPVPAESRPALKFIVPHRPWMQGFSITANEWNFNKVDQVKTDIDESASIVANHPSELLQDLVESAETTYDPIDGSDGIYIISATHPIDDGAGSTQSNLWTSTDVPALDVATATKPTSAEWAVACVGLASKLVLTKNRRGQYCMKQLRDFTIAVGPALYPSLIVALAQQNLSSGESNPLKSGIKYRVKAMLLPGYAGTATGFILADNQRAMILQYLEKPSRPDVFGPGTEFFRLNNFARVQSRGQYNAAWDRYEAIAHFTLS